MTAGPLTLRPILLPLAVALLTAGCGASPTAPERHGPITVVIQCEPTDAQTSRCAATVDCGLYGCYPGTPHDITATAAWKVDDPAVARVNAPGQLERVAPGDTVVRASQAGVGENYSPISVFAGTAPLQTFIVSGTVTDGSNAAHPPLSGATVEILDGLVAGRRAASGIAPPYMPGYWAPTGFFGSGDYEFFGIPKGTYTLRASKPGYLSQERVGTIGGGSAQFALVRAE